MRDAVLKYEFTPGTKPQNIVVRLNGPLTLLNLFGFQDQLRQIDTELIVFDFEHVPYMDSAGLGAVVNLYVSTGNKGRKIALAAVNTRVMSIFQQTKVDQVLSFFPNVEAAEASA